MNLTPNETVIWNALNKASNPLTSTAELWVLMEHPLLVVRFAAAINPNSPNIKLGMMSRLDSDARLQAVAALTLLDRPQEGPANINKPRELDPRDSFPAQHTD